MTSYVRQALMVFMKWYPAALCDRDARYVKLRFFEAQAEKEDCSFKVYGCLRSVCECKIFLLNG